MKTIQYVGFHQFAIRAGSADMTTLNTTYRQDYLPGYWPREARMGGLEEISTIIFPH